MTVIKAAAVQLSPVLQQIADPSPRALNVHLR